MKAMSRLVLVVVAMAVFLPGFQANVRVHGGGGGGTGDVIIVSG